jgi:DNA-binding NtrC family response regulator
MANILLVDDQAAVLQVCLEILSSAGHAVTTAVNGKEAMRLIHVSKFDLVITDLLMPEKEGLEVIMELRRTIPTLKIIAMSGGGRIDAKDYLATAKQFGASQTLSKPFTGKELLEVVSAALKEAA